MNKNELYSTRVILRAFLQKCPREESVNLYRYLSSSERKGMDELPDTLGDPLQDDEAPELQLSRIHSSWIAPFLRTLSNKEIGFFLSSLTPIQAAFVSKDLLYAGEIPKLPSPVKLYLQKTLLRYLTAELEVLLPISRLPKAPLNQLIEIDNQIFNDSLVYLGLHDVFIEMSQIIEKEKLNQLYDTLSPSQLNYLKCLNQQNKPVSFARIGLSQWNGNKEKLQLLIRKRGANRLGKALWGQNPSLVWYLLHKLDVEQALMVQQFCTPLKNNHALNLIIKEILQFITYVKEV